MPAVNTPDCLRLPLLCACVCAGRPALDRLAPLPSSKAKVVQDTVATGLGFLAEGK
jgi:hypothetical protein